MNTKTNILQAAVWLFLKYGYNSVSVSDIAQRAKVSKGGLYHYFSSKQSLAEAVVDSYMQQNYLRIKSSIDSQQNTSEQLRAVFQHLKTDTNIWAGATPDDVSGDPSAVPRFLYEVAKNNESLRNRISESYERVIHDLETALDSGKQRGYVRKDVDCNHFALTYFSMYRGLMSLWAFNPSIDIDGKARRMAEDLWPLVKA